MRARAKGEERVTYRPDDPGCVPLPGPGAKFIPDGTGGGALAYVDREGVAKVIRKEAHRAT